jgi:hypothetical protein
MSSPTAQCVPANQGPGGKLGGGKGTRHAPPQPSTCLCLLSRPRSPAAPPSSTAALPTSPQVVPEMGGCGRRPGGPGGAPGGGLRRRRHRGEMGHRQQEGHARGLREGLLVRGRAGRRRAWGCARHAHRNVGRPGIEPGQSSTGGTIRGSQAATQIEGTPACCCPLPCHPIARRVLRGPRARRSHRPGAVPGTFEALPCNAFSWCGADECFEPDAHRHTKGDCWLKWTEAPARPEVRGLRQGRQESSQRRSGGKDGCPAAPSGGSLRVQAPRPVAAGPPARARVAVIPTAAVHTPLLSWRLSACSSTCAATCRATTRPATQRRPGASNGWRACCCRLGCSTPTARGARGGAGDLRSAAGHA